MQDIQEILNEYQADGQRTLHGIKTWMAKKGIAIDLIDHAVTETFLLLAGMTKEERKESVPDGNDLDHLIYLVARSMQKDIDKVFVAQLNKRLENLVATPQPVTVNYNRPGYWRNLWNAICGN